MKNKNYFLISKIHYLVIKYIRINNNEQKRFTNVFDFDFMNLSY